METQIENWRRTRSKIAHAKKANPAADVSQLRQQLKAERLADYVRRTVEAAPPLTAAQRDRIALYLRGGAK